MRRNSNEARVREGHSVGEEWKRQVNATLRNRYADRYIATEKRGRSAHLNGEVKPIRDMRRKGND